MNGDRRNLPSEAARPATHAGVDVRGPTRQAFRRDYHAPRPAARNDLFEGEDANRVYLLLSGVAKLTFLNASERILVSLVGPGEIFGVSSLLTVAKRPFRCDAFSDCLVGVISPEAFVDAALGVRLED